jgi:hypothetical protein
MSSEMIAIHVYAALGWLLVTAVLAALWLATGVLGVAAFKRLTRVYHLSVIGYWLGRLEKSGHRVFQKAEQDDIQKQEQRAKKAWEYEV